MSVISNRHQFGPFISGTSKPMHEQRLAKVGYKAKSGKSSVCVSIPMLSDSDVDHIMLAFPVDARKRVEDFQDALIRSLYESGKSEIASEELSVGQIRQYLEAENSAGRLTGEKVKEWFLGDFQEIALPVLSEKYGTNDESILAKKVQAWTDVFVKMCGNSAIDLARLKQLQNMCEFVESDDPIGTRVKSKIDTMIAECESLESL